MESPRILPFTLKYGLLFALGWVLLAIPSQWQTLAHAFYSKPIVLRGVGGITLSLLGVEIAVIAVSAVVVGIGASFIGWMMKNGEDIDGQLFE